eukprot:SAG11_NODE_615_length_8197_cov_4.551426_12_plen_134_part_01
MICTRARCYGLLLLAACRWNDVVASSVLALDGWCGGSIRILLEAPSSLSPSFQSCVLTYDYNRVCLHMIVGKEFKCIYTCGSDLEGYGSHDSKNINIYIDILINKCLEPSSNYLSPIGVRSLSHGVPHIECGYP